MPISPDTPVHLVSTIDPETGDRIVTSVAWTDEEIAAEAASASDAARRELHEVAAAKRSALVDGGYSMHGATVGTDAAGRSLLLGAMMRAQLDSTASFGWRQPDGSVVTLSSAQVVEIAVAVGLFVQACFDVQASVDEAIDAGTIATTFDVLHAAAWPANHS